MKFLQPHLLAAGELHGEVSPQQEVVVGLRCGGCLEGGGQSCNSHHTAALTFGITRLLFAISATHGFALNLDQCMML